MEGKSRVCELGYVNSQAIYGRDVRVNTSSKLLNSLQRNGKCHVFKLI